MTSVYSTCHISMYVRVVECSYDGRGARHAAGRSVSCDSAASAAQRGSFSVSLVVIVMLLCFNCLVTNCN